MSKSRYIRWHKQRVPKPRRPSRMPAANTVSVEKTSDESGKWVRCRRCGFPINVDAVNPGGDEMTEDSVQVSDFDYEEPNRTFRGSNPQPGNQYNRPALVDGDYGELTLDAVDMVGTLIQTGADGNADPFTYTPRQTTITSGCPFCGSDLI